MSGERILIYTDESTPGGVAHYNHTILTALVHAGWRVAASQPRHATPMLAAQRDLGIQHLEQAYEPRLAFSRSFVDTAAAESAILPAKPDLILFSDCSPISNLAAKHVAIVHRIPFLSICHSSAAYLAERFPQCLSVVRKQFQQAREQVAVSQKSLDVLHTVFGLASDRGVVIYNGRPPAFFEPVDPAVRRRIRAELGIPDDGVLAFTTARLDAAKGYQYQLLAIKALKETNRLGPLYFAWAGEGDFQASLEANVAALRIPERVAFLGQRWDMPELLGAADLFVLTSMNESMPLSVIEAMARGLPVIATTVGGMPEEVAETGKLLPDPNLDALGTVTGLAQTLIAWAADPSLRARLGQAAHRRAASLFTEAMMVKNTLAVLARVASAAIPV